MSITVPAASSIDVVVFAIDGAPAGVGAYNLRCDPSAIDGGADTGGGGGADGGGAGGNDGSTGNDAPADGGTGGGDAADGPPDAASDM
jgi:hypothetical protein